MHTRLGRIALGIGALALALIAGCKSDKESLVVVSVTADAMASALTSLTLSSSGASKTFALVGGLSPTAQQFGLYVPSDVTGLVTVSAVASGAAACTTYRGEGTADILEAGATTNPPTPIRLTPSATCGSDGGAGSGGATSTGGTVGAGGAGSGGATSTGGTVGAGGGGSGGTTSTGGTVGTGGMGGSAGGKGGAGGVSGTGGKAGAGGSAGGAGSAGTPGSGGTGGASSTGGSSGTGGSSATGCASTPAVGTPPLLTCCQEYDHADADCAVAAGVQGVAFSPDGTLLATAASDKTVKIWSFDGKELTATGTTLKAPGTYVYGFVAFSPDGKYLAVGADGEVDVYNVAGWTAAGPPLTIGTDMGVAFAPDSQHVVSFDGLNVYVHLVGTAKALTSNSLGYIFSSFALGTTPGPGGLVIATGGDELLSGVGDVGTGIVYLLSSQYALNRGVTLVTGTAFQDNELYASAVAPNGTTVAYGDGHSQVWFSTVPSSTVTIPESSSLTLDPTGYQSIYGIAYSPQNGNYLAVAAGTEMNGNPGSVTIWNVSSKNTSYAQYSGVTEQPISVAFSPNGNAIVVGEDQCGKVLLCTN